MLNFDIYILYRVIQIVPICYKNGGFNILYTNLV